MKAEHTRIAAYTKDSTLAMHGSNSQRIVAALKEHGPASRLDLAKRLGKGVNSITAPVFALIKKGTIEVSPLMQIQPETNTLAALLRIPKGK